MFPIHFRSSWICELFNTNAFSFFVFCVYKTDKYLHDLSYRNHEYIHYLQQVELLFVFHWLLYSYFAIARSYGENPFEKEAFKHEKDTSYHLYRPWYNWRKFI